MRRQVAWQRKKCHLVSYTRLRPHTGKAQLCNPRPPGLQPAAGAEGGGGKGGRVSKRARPPKTVRGGRIWLKHVLNVEDVW